jgi:hypothetical protein
LKRNEDVRGFSTEGEIRPKRRPSGVYDPNILCPECDHSLPDDYADALLHEKLTKARPGKYGEFDLMVFDRFDYHQLRLFFISLLWRASISTKIGSSLGRVYENQARSAIVTGNPYALNISVIIIRASKTFDDSNVCVPLRAKLDGGANIWTTRTSKFHFMMKVSRKDWPISEMRELTVKRDRPLLIPVFKNDTRELNFIQEMFHKNEKWNVWK